MTLAHLTSSLAMAACAGLVLASTAVAQDAQAPAVQTSPQTPPQTTAIIDPPITPTPAVPDAAPASSLTMPKWSEFPLPPKNVPTKADIAADVKEQNAKATRLSAQVAGLKWDPEVAEPFRKQLLSRIDPAYLKPIDAPMSLDAIEALGADLRRRAVPPPVAN